MKAHGLALWHMLANPPRSISAENYSHTLPITLLTHVSTRAKRMSRKSITLRGFTYRVVAWPAALVSRRNVYYESIRKLIWRQLVELSGVVGHYAFMSRRHSLSI